MYFLFVAISVSFSQTTYRVNERDGVVTVELTLNKSSPCCLRLYVEVEDITATSKLCMCVWNVQYASNMFIINNYEILKYSVYNCTDKAYLPQ